MRILARRLPRSWMTTRVKGMARQLKSIAAMRPPLDDWITQSVPRGQEAHTGSWARGSRSQWSWTGCRRKGGYWGSSTRRAAWGVGHRAACRPASRLNSLASWPHAPLILDKELFEDAADAFRLLRVDEDEEGAVVEDGGEDGRRQELAPPRIRLPSTPHSEFVMSNRRRFQITVKLKN